MDGQVIEQTKMRAAIARRMVESKQRAPHFYVQTEVAIDAIWDRLQRLNERGEAHATMTVVLIRATVEALRRHPKLNSVWTPEGLLQASTINLGIAIALDEGLVAPALLGAEDLSVRGIVAALEDLVKRARASRLRPAEMAEATFAVSNLERLDGNSIPGNVTQTQVAMVGIARKAERLSK